MARLTASVPTVRGALRAPTSIIVTMALLYCRPPILSNCTQRTAVAGAIGCDHGRCGSGIGQLEVRTMMEEQTGTVTTQSA